MEGFIVQQILDFFSPPENKNRSFDDFLRTQGVFKDAGGGMEEVDYSKALRIQKICNQLIDEGLLIMYQGSSVPFLFDKKYVSYPLIPGRQDDAINDLHYGAFDFKYNGFPFVREAFENSVVPIVGVHEDGKEDMGTAYCIGGNLFVTAAHCVKDLKCFNLLKPDGNIYEIRELLFSRDTDTYVYDLSVIVLGEDANCKPFLMADPEILDQVLTIGFPQIPGFLTIQTAETASISTYIQGERKASLGEVVADKGKTVFSRELDNFIITSRVKGGNSGSPVINECGKVVGTVFQIPFDDTGGSDVGRYDLMGYGICLPSKYVRRILDSPRRENVSFDGRYHSIA